MKHELFFYVLIVFLVTSMQQLIAQEGSNVLEIIPLSAEENPLARISEPHIESLILGMRHAAVVVYDADERLNLNFVIGIKEMAIPFEIDHGISDSFSITGTTLTLSQRIHATSSRNDYSFVEVITRNVTDRHGKAKEEQFSVVSNMFESMKVVDEDTLTPNTNKRAIVVLSPSIVTSKQQSKAIELLVQRTVDQLLTQPSAYLVLPNGVFGNELLSRVDQRLGKVDRNLVIWTPDVCGQLNFEPKS